MNIDWINELIDLFPETSTGRKNLIAIAGYPKWEIVNSNLMAFYFDEKEEHGFSRLFINSLLDIYDSKKMTIPLPREIFETDFSVEREVSTNSGGRIDILIREEVESEDDNDEPTSNWAIIIENKLFASLYNNLNDYWKSVNSDNKLIVVLSLTFIDKPKEIENKKINFINITHRELIDKVKQNLSDFYLDSDDRHLLFLKEYISNVNSFYIDKKDTMKMDTTLQLFHSKKEDIEEFKKVDLELLKYVSKSVFNIMTEVGFPPYSTKDSSKSKHFYVNAESENLNPTLKDNIEFVKKFRFWINLSRLRYCGTFAGYFELWGVNNTKYGDELKLHLSEMQIFTENVQLGTSGRSGGGYQHIYNISIPIGDLTNKTFDNQLRTALQDCFFNHSNNFIENAVLSFKKLIEKR